MRNKNKTTQKLLTAVILAAILFSVCSCSGFGALGDLASGLQDFADNWEKYEEALSKLTNYKIVIESVDESGNKSVITEMRCDEGYAMITNDSITYVEYAKGKMYVLSTGEKTGWAYESSETGENKGFGIALYGYLYTFEAYKLLGAKESGSDKISGRKTTTYTFNQEGQDWKFWTDDEYGLTMKYTQKSEDGTSSMEVTEFKTSGIKLSDMVDLGEYEIQDLNALG